MDQERFYNDYVMYWKIEDKGKMMIWLRARVAKNSGVYGFVVHKGGVSHIFKETFFGYNSYQEYTYIDVTKLHIEYLIDVNAFRHLKSYSEKILGLIDQRFGEIVNKFEWEGQMERLPI